MRPINEIGLTAIKGRASSVSSINVIYVCVKYFSPFRCGPYFAHIFNKPSVSAIVVLFRFCRPSTIFFEIPHSHINSIKRHTARSLTHIIQKVSKIVPSVFNGNSNAAIVGEAVNFRLIAPLHHGLPRQVSWAAHFLSAMPMRLVLFPHFASAFPFCASAAFDASFSKVIRRDHSCVSAITYASHFPLASLVQHIAVDNETAKSGTNRDVFSFHGERIAHEKN